MHPCSEVIRTLSPSEKRYISSDIKNSRSGKAYSDLFHQLCTTEEEGEAVRMTRLYEFVLRSMTSYHRHKSTLTRLMNMVSEIEFLHSKHLYELCLKQVRKAKKLAEEVEDELTLLRLMQWETTLSKEQGVYLERSRKFLDEAYQKESDLIDSYRLFTRYKYHVLDLLMLSRNRIGPIGSEHLKKYDRLMKDPEFDRDPETLTIPQKIFFFNLKAMYFFANGNIQKSGQYFHLVVSMIESNPNIEERFRTEYFMALNNLAITQAYLQDYSISLELLSKVRDLFGDDSAFDPDLFAVTECYRVGVLNSIGKHEEVHRLSEDISIGLNRYQVNPASRHLYYYNLAIAAFWTKNYQECNRWTNHLLNEYHENRDQAVSNLHYYGNILLLITQYEMGKLDLLEFSVPSTRRFLKRIRPLNNFEEHVLDAIEKELTTINIQTSEGQVFNRLHEELSSQMATAEAQFARQFFDFERWIFEKTDRFKMTNNRKSST